MLSAAGVWSLGKLALSLGAAGSKAFGQEGLARKLEVVSKSGELIDSALEQRAEVVRDTLAHLRKRIELEQRDWLASEIGGDILSQADARAAYAALEFVLPRCVPDTAAVVRAKYDASTIADLVVQQAALIDDQFRRPKIGPQILQCLVRETYTLLRSERAFCDLTEIPFRESVLNSLADIKEMIVQHAMGKDKCPAYLRAGLQELDDYNAQNQKTTTYFNAGASGASDSSVIVNKVNRYLPVLPPRIFGREILTGELVSACLATTAPRILVLGGLGIGKSTLTSAIAAHPELVERFGERRWFVGLETADEARKLETGISAVLGLDLSLPFESVLARLVEAPGLLVLDNLETPWWCQETETETLLRRLAELPELTLLASVRGGAERVNDFETPGLVI